MECHDFRKYIPEFADCKLKYRQAQECLNHVKNCPMCRDELEIYFIVEYGIKNDTAYSGAFVLKDIVDECFAKEEKLVAWGIGKRNFFTAVRILIYIAIIVGIIIFLVRFL